MFHTFLKETTFFRETYDDNEDDWDQVQMSSFLRVFKLLGEKDLLLKAVQTCIVEPHCQRVATEAFALKKNSVQVLKG
jgi:hypothetical protein